MDSQVGTCVHAQLAKRANSAEAAVALMKSQPFLIETKFDGNRIQLHYAAGRDGQPPQVEYFTRNMQAFSRRG